ncbi:MAG TPA: hypothetical protein VJ935_09030 [Acidimicrobiia bacterium]|nr:hypothetical protein [Acidimicrobiia bacterium]
MTLLFVLGLFLAVVTAVRSTWSPCGVSMLSVITPLQEQGRGNRFRATAIWFLLGATAGGAVLGGSMAILAEGWQRLGAGEEAALVITSLGAMLAVVSDGRLFGVQLPGHDRQVNERWLDQYRSWVYGAGFGWQIGVGLATYIMTAGLYLLIVVAAVGASPSGALIIGAVFGIVRGLAVFAAGDVTTLESLNDLHRRFERWRQPVRKLTIDAIALVGMVAGLAVDSTLGVALVVSLTLTAAAALRGERETSYVLAR